MPRVTSFSNGGVEELFVTAVPADGADTRAMFERVMDPVRAAGARVVSQDVFGIPAAGEAGLQALTEAAGGVDWPVTWVETGAAAPAALAGTQLHAVRGAPVTRIGNGERIAGSVFENAFGTFCRMGDIRADSSGPPSRQARETFERMETCLKRAGMDFSHVVRTWLYLDDILSWYGDFNSVRTGFFAERNVPDGILPASTGVGGSNPAGAAVAAGAVAVRPKAGVRVSPVTSPLQGPAGAYHSSFSRAVEIEAPNCRQLLISGTASIDPNGRTAHAGDVEKQIELTLRVVHAILESRGMDWRDGTRAIAYFKRGSDARVFERYRAELLPALPLVMAEGDICRDELLFEIEVDAVRIRT